MSIEDKTENLVDWRLLLEPGYITRKAFAMTEDECRKEGNSSKEDLLFNVGLFEMGRLAVYGATIAGAYQIYQKLF